MPAVCQIVRARVKTSAVRSDVLSVWWEDSGLKSGPIFLFNTVVQWYVNSAIFWLHNGIHHILPYIANINHYHRETDELLNIKEGYCLGNLINNGHQSKVWVFSLERKQRHFIYVIQILLYGRIWLNHFIVWEAEKKYCVHDFYFLKKKTFLFLKISVVI